MRLWNNTMELFSEMSPLALGAWGLGAIIAAPILSSGLRSLAVAVVKGGLEITDQARNATYRAKSQWEQVVNDARQQQAPNWGLKDSSVAGAALGGAIGAGLGSAAGPAGAAAGGGLGAGLGSTIANETEQKEQDNNSSEHETNF